MIDLVNDYKLYKDLRISFSSVDEHLHVYEDESVVVDCREHFDEEVR